MPFPAEMAYQKTVTMHLTLKMRMNKYLVQAAPCSVKLAYAKDPAPQTRNKDLFKD